MSLDDLIALTIDAQTTSPSRAGFGTPLILAYHTAWVSDLVREYGDLAEMVADGFLVTDSAYLIAQSIVSQNPKPSSFKVGRRTTAPSTKTYRLTPTDTTEDFVYTINVFGTAITYTVLAAATVASIVTAMQALIDAIVGISCSDDTTHLTVTNDTAGENIRIFGKSRALLLEDLTADAGIVAELTAVIAEDDDWYALLIDSQSSAEILAAAVNMETRKKIFLADTADDIAYDSGSTTDVMYLANAAGYTRTAIAYHSDTGAFMAAAWLGDRLPQDPGKATWKFKNLAGIAFDALRTGDRSAMDAKKGNYYYRIGTSIFTGEGWTASGEYIDIVRGIDWLGVRIQEDVFADLLGNQKIPYTDKGINGVAETIHARLRNAITVGLLAEDPAPTVTPPLVADILTAEKAVRNVPGILFTGTLAGAVHSLSIAGTLTL